MDASIFDSALSHTRRSDASKKREENSVSTFGRFRLLTSFEFSPVLVNENISEFEPPPIPHSERLPAFYVPNSVLKRAPEGMQIDQNISQ